jgi:hypothetical protein
MSVVHGGTRNATIRVPEEAVILKLSKRASTDLTVKFPLLNEELTKLAEKREAGQLGFDPPGLQGNTAFFDLPTVIQAVTASRQTGQLKILATANTPAAKLVFMRGVLNSAEFKHLSGEHAVFELLCVHDPADFSFERLSESSLAASNSPKSTFRQLERLLIDGARRSDELLRLTDTIGGLGMTFSAATDKPAFDALPGNVRDLARQIWKLVESDLTVEEMLPMLEVDRFTLLRALSDMLDKGILKKLVTLHNPSTPTFKVQLDDHANLIEIDFNQRKQPAKLAATFYALNMVASNLATFVSSDTVKTCLEEALVESAKSYPQLTGLKVHPGGKTLDIRGASPELTRRTDSRKALTHLTMRFLQALSEHSGGRAGG